MAPRHAAPRWTAAAILIPLALTALTPVNGDDPHLIDVDEDVLSASRKAGSLVVSVYRMLHQVPELLYDLNKTSAVVRKVLDDMDVNYKYVGRRLLAENVSLIQSSC